MSAAGATRTSSHGRNVILNFVGLGVPAIAALFALPLIVGRIGVDRLGVLTLAWAIIGYFGIFDLGLGRALTHAVAERIGRRERHTLSGIVWSSLAIMSSLGVAAGVGMWLATPWLVESILNVPDPLLDETRSSFYLLALSTPFVILTSGLRGILEATERFDLLNAIRIPMGLLTYAGPLLVLPFTTSLPAIVASLVVMRIAATLAHAWLCRRALPEFRVFSRPRASRVAPIVRTGAWMSISSVALPLMVTLDRFLIGAFLTVAAVAYYATPYEVVTKLWIIPAAITGVLFPALAQRHAQDREGAIRILRAATRYTLILVFPIVAGIVLFAHEGLTLWMGADFAVHATRPMQWLAIGVLFSCIDSLAFSALQAFGRSARAAMAQLALLPIHVALIAFAIPRWGIDAAAGLWCLRMIVETGVLLVLLRGPSGASLSARELIALLLAGAAAGALLLVSGAALPARLLIGVGALAGFLLFSWRILLPPEDRNRIYMALARYAILPRRGPEHP